MWIPCLKVASELLVKKRRKRWKLTFCSAAFFLTFVLNLLLISKGKNADISKLKLKRAH